MRVSDNMTSHMAAKSGLPVYMSSMGESSKGTLLDALDKSSWEDGFSKTSALDTKKTRELIKAADKLSDIGSVFDTDGKDDKLYEAAKNNNDLSELIGKTKEFASGYNGLLKRLDENEGGLFALYKSELKNAASEQREALSEMGISFDKDGYMSVDEEKLKGADIDEFRNSMDIFSHKATFIAGRVSENVNAAAESISSRYDAFGKMLSHGTGRFDLLG